MVKQILPNLYRVKIPLPESPLRTLNSYFIVSPERCLIIDTGMNQEECLRRMQSALRELNVDLKRTDFFITHWHADHLGLVSTLAAPNSRIYFNQKEARILTSTFKERWWGIVEFARRHGFPKEELESVFNTHPARYGFKEHLDFSIVKEGDEISIGDYNFVCLETPGHSPGHLCLYEPNKKVLISGDHLLEDISPNVSLYSDKANPLQEYLDSLDRIYELEVQLVLPGHGRIFQNHRRRVRELKRHHEARVGEVLSLLKKGEQTAYEIASQMSWELNYKNWEDFPAFQKWFAFGEALSHLAYLEEKGLVARRINNEVKFYLK